MLTELFTLVDTVTSANITTYTTPFTNLFIPMLGAGIALYMLFKAYEIIWTDKDVMSETMKTVTSLMIVFSIALGSDYYFTYIVPFILNSGSDISYSLMGTVGGASALESMFETVVEWIGDIWSDADGWGESAQALGVIMFLLPSSLLFIALSALYLLVAKIMVSFLLIIGQLFICFAFFPSTRQYFTAWTQQCSNYIMLSFMYTLAFGLFEQLFSTLVTTDLQFESAMSAIVLFVIMIFVANQIPTFTSSLSGGVGINGLGSGILSGLHHTKSLLSSKDDNKGNNNGGSGKSGFAKKAIMTKFRNYISAG